MEGSLDNLVDITIPVAPEAADVLRSPARREAAGRYISGLLKEGVLRDLVAQSIVATKEEARSNGLSDAEIDAELEAWRSERDA